MQPDVEVRVSLEASLSPSENAEAVAVAMNGLLSCECPASQERLVLRLTASGVECLEKIRNQFRDRHVRGAARRLLLLGVKGHSTELMLNRQAAVAGVVALCSSPEQSPLGPIHVRIESKELDSVIDWLTAYESG